MDIYKLKEELIAAHKETKKEMQEIIDSGGPCISTPELSNLRSQELLAAYAFIKELFDYVDICEVKFDLPD
mgnify:FL=1